MYEIVQSNVLKIKELRCNQRRTTETKNDTFVIRSHLPGEPFDNSAEWRPCAAWRGRRRHRLLAQGQPTVCHLRPFHDLVRIEIFQRKGIGRNCIIFCQREGGWRSIKSDCFFSSKIIRFPDCSEHSKLYVVWMGLDGWIDLRLPEP